MVFIKLFTFYLKKWKKYIIIIVARHRKRWPICNNDLQVTTVNIFWVFNMMIKVAKAVKTQLEKVMNNMNIITIHVCAVFIWVIGSYELVWFYSKWSLWPCAARWTAYKSIHNFSCKNGDFIQAWRRIIYCKKPDLGISRCWFIHIHLFTAAASEKYGATRK